MSTNRENVTWLSPRDGLWYGGFFAFDYVNQDSPDFDFEWDVEYDMGRFGEVTRQGQPTSEAAFQELARGHSNPGGSWSTSDPNDGARYDLMADECGNKGRSGRW